MLYYTLHYIVECIPFPSFLRKFFWNEFHCSTVTHLTKYCIHIHKYEWSTVMLVLSQCVCFTHLASCDTRDLELHDRCVCKYYCWSLLVVSVEAEQKHFLPFFRFLDVLAARKDPSGLMGQVLIDGAPQPPNFKCLSGYVVQVGWPARLPVVGERLTPAATPLCVSPRLQDDVVMGTLTVRENLNFSAALRLPAAIPQDEKEQMVDKLILELGLGRVANSKVRKSRRRRKEEEEHK